MNQNEPNKEPEATPQDGGLPSTALLCLPTYSTAYRACGFYERSYFSGCDKRKLWGSAVKKALQEREEISKNSA